MVLPALWWGGGAGREGTIPLRGGVDGPGTNAYIYIYSDGPVLSHIVMGQSCLLLWCWWCCLSRTGHVNQTRINLPGHYSMMWHNYVMRDGCGFLTVHFQGLVYTQVITWCCRQRQVMFSNPWNFKVPRSGGGRNVNRVCTNIVIKCVFCLFVRSLISSKCLITGTTILATNVAQQDTATGPRITGWTRIWACGWRAKKVVSS